MNRQDAKSAKKGPEPDAELDALAFQVIGAAIEVHRHLGPGFLESIYHEAMEIELGLRDIPYTSECPVTINFKGHRLHREHRLDLLVNKRLVVEFKAVQALEPIHEAVVRSYLKATQKELALLINFNTTVLKDGIRRIINSPS